MIIHSPDPSHCVVERDSTESMLGACLDRASQRKALCSGENFPLLQIVFRRRSIGSTIFLLGQHRINDPVHPVELSNYLTSSDKTRRTGLQMVWIVQKIRLNVHEISNNDIEIIENTFNVLQVGAARRQPQKRHTIVRKERVATHCVDRGILKHDNAVGRLQVRWMTGNVDAQLRDKQLQEETPVGRFQPTAAHYDGLEAENAAVRRHRHDCARTGDRSRIPTTLTGALVCKCAAIPPKNVSTIRGRLVDGDDAPTRDAPSRNGVRHTNRLQRLAKESKHDLAGKAKSTHVQVDGALRTSETSKHPAGMVSHGLERGRVLPKQRPGVLANERHQRRHQLIVKPATASKYVAVDGIAPWRAVIPIVGRPALQRRLADANVLVDRCTRNVVV